VVHKPADYYCDEEVELETRRVSRDGELSNNSAGRRSPDPSSS
jgi:hypothetical protein